MGVSIHLDGVWMDHEGVNEWKSWDERCTINVNRRHIHRCCD